MDKFSNNEGDTTNLEKLAFAINFCLCKFVAMVDMQFKFSAVVALALADAPWLLC